MIQSIMVIKFQTFSNLTKFYTYKTKDFQKNPLFYKMRRCMFTMIHAGLYKKTQALEVSFLSRNFVTYLVELSFFCHVFFCKVKKLLSNFM